jgi:DNA-binding NtrC family response regulator
VIGQRSWSIAQASSATARASDREFALHRFATNAPRFDTTFRIYGWSSSSHPHLTAVSRAGSATERWELAPCRAAFVCKPARRLRMQTDTLLVLELTESFSAFWPALARDVGLVLESVSDTGAIANHQGPAVAIVAAGGQETSLESSIRELLSSPIDVAAVIADGDHRLAVSLMRAGASEVFVLPQDVDALRTWLKEQRARLAGSGDSAAHPDDSRRYEFSTIFGASPLLRAALEQAARIIPHPQVTALISGETGTGKELLARALHDQSPRSTKPFIEVNCAAIPKELLEGELFGQTRSTLGAATNDKPGLFEIANGGTLFLDEVGRLPLQLQGTLLRALDERAVRRVGGTTAIPVDVRVIAATHGNLARAVRRGEFRQDLYYRLNVVPIMMPPLRSRPDDVLPLATHFLTRFARDYGLADARFTAAAERALRTRSWPGNVRELRNIIERAVLLARSPMIDAPALEHELDDAPPTNNAAAHRLDAIIHRAVCETVDLCAGNKSDAARRLGISRTRLQRLLTPDRRVEAAESVTSPT